MRYESIALLVVYPGRYTLESAMRMIFAKSRSIYGGNSKAHMYGSMAFTCLYQVQTIIYVKRNIYSVRIR